MNCQTIVQLSKLEELKGRGVLEMLNRVQEVSQTRPFGSVAFHSISPASTATMEHPYLFFKKEYEVAKKTYQALVENIKADAQYQVERADDERLIFHYSFEDEDYGLVECSHYEWFNEVSKASCFSEHVDKGFVLVTLKKGTEEGVALAAYQTMEEALKDIKQLLAMIESENQTGKITHTTWYCGEGHRFEGMMDENQSFKINVETFPIDEDFHK